MSEKRPFARDESAIALSLWFDYCPRLYLILSIPLGQYDSFVKTIAPTSPAYQILMNGVYERQDKGDHYERTMNITCNDWEAQMLLDLANKSYPNIAPDIASNIARAKRIMAF